MLIANMLVKIQCPDDAVLFKASVLSIVDVCDRVLILSTEGIESVRFLRDLLEGHLEKVFFCSVPPGTVEERGFAYVRNILLDMVPVGDHILWVDSDEVHFPEQLLVIKEKVLPFKDEVVAHFIHFTIGANTYEKFESRRIIFRRDISTLWNGKVHEAASHSPTIVPRIFHSDYHYFHLGYCRDQSVIADRWKQYTALEGDNPDRIDQEYPDHRVLDHRLDSLITYFGEYPSTLPPEWVSSKMIEI